jgi:uncharacterized protein (DUF1015 family)
VLPHERTLSGPKVDRHKLMRATGANLSPLVGLYADPSGRSAAILARVAATPAALDITDDDGVRQRLWVVADTGAGSPIVEELTALAGATPVTIADGHHRYETALRYRDERRVTPSTEADPAFDFVLMLFLESTGEPLTVLATHRVVLRLGDADGTGLVAAAGSLFDVEPMDDGTALAAAFAPAAFAPGGEGRLGLWTRSGGAILRARRESFEPHLPPGGAALRRLDVTLLEVALERLCRIDAAAIASGERVAYVKSSAEAVDVVSRRIGGADAAFLLDPVPVADIIAVAADGDVMPQKSTYFYPKAVTGLVLNPLEW